MSDVNNEGLGLGRVRDEGFVSRFRVRVWYNHKIRQSMDKTKKTDTNTRQQHKVRPPPSPPTKDEGEEAKATHVASFSREFSPNLSVITVL